MCIRDSPKPLGISRHATRGKQPRVVVVLPFSSGIPALWRHYFRSSSPWLYSPSPSPGGPPHRDTRKLLQTGVPSSPPCCGAARRGVSSPAPGSTSSARSTTRSASPCLLYTSDAADDLTRVDLGGRR